MGKQTRFKNVITPACHGRWERISAGDECPCPDGPHFIFVWSAPARINPLHLSSDWMGAIGDISKFFLSSVFVIASFRTENTQTWMYIVHVYTCTYPQHITQKLTNTHTYTNTNIHIPILYSYYPYFTINANKMINKTLISSLYVYQNLRFLLSVFTQSQGQV